MNASPQYHDTSESGRIATSQLTPRLHGEDERRVRIRVGLSSNPSPMCLGLTAVLDFGEVLCMSLALSEFVALDGILPAAKANTTLGTFRSHDSIITRTHTATNYT